MLRQFFQCSVFAGWVGIAIALGVGSAVAAPAASQVTATDLDALWAQKLADATGKTKALAAFKGKVVVLNFWATWCPPCRREMPGFSKLNLNYQSQNVQFVGIAIDTPENVRDFAQQYPVSYPLLIGGNGAVELSRRLGNTGMGLPYTVILDAAGQVRRQKLGGYAEAALESDILSILRP